MLAGHEAWLQAIGGLLLVVIAIRRHTGRRAVIELAHVDRPKLSSSFFGPLLLTWANPATILSFAAVLGALGLDVGHAGPLDAALLVVGVLMGAIAWWVVVVSVAARLRGRSAPRSLHRFDRAVTLGVGTFGGVLLVLGACSLCGGP